MKRKAAAIFATLTTVALCWVGWVAYRGVVAYRTAMAMTPPAIECVVDSSRLHTLLDEIEVGVWTTVGEGKNGIEELFQMLMLPPGMDGYVAFYGFTPSPVSAFDRHANQRRAAIALVRVGLVPRADDGKFHVTSDNGFGAIFLSDSVVSFHRLVDGRCVDGSMIRTKKEAEQDG